MVLHGGPLADRERTRHPSPVHNASVDGDAGAADNPDPDARPRAQATGGEWPTRPQCMVVVCLSSGALAAGPFVGTSFAARTKDCGHVLVGPGGNAIGIADIRATRVSCARARLVFRAVIKDKFHPPKGWRFIKGPDGSPITLGSGRARVEGFPYNG
jgi:hypothetical protein